MSASNSVGSTFPESMRVIIFSRAASGSISIWAWTYISSSSACFLKAISFILLAFNWSSLSTSTSALKASNGKISIQLSEFSQKKRHTAFTVIQPCRYIYLQNSNTCSIRSSARAPGTATSSTEANMLQVTWSNNFLSSIGVSIRFHRSISWFVSSWSCGRKI